MKKISKWLCSLLISFFTLAFFFSLLYSYFTSSRFLIDIIKQTNYEKKAYDNVIQELKNQTTEEEIKKMISSCITEEKVTQDIERMITSFSSNTNLSSTIQSETRTLLKKTIQNNFQEEIDPNSLEEFVNVLTNSYMKNLFPYNEFYKLGQKRISIAYLIPIGLFCLLMSFLFTLLSFFLHKKRPLEIFYRANFISGIVMLAPFCFCHLYHLFQNFYYCNEYFSILIRKTFYVMIDLLGMIGFLLVFATIILEFYQINKKILKGK